MKISIIIPVYNGEKYIERNFDSIRQQIFRDFEIIYVNDGSTDGSLDKLEKIKDNHKDNFQIKIINNENGGERTARNPGMDAAEGEYLCFIDIDDEIMPDYLSYMLNLIQKYNVNLVFCSTSPKKDFVQKDKDIKEKVYSKEKALKAFLYRKIKPGIWSILCKKQFMKNSILNLQVNYKYSEDIHMIWRLFNVNDYVVGTTKKLYIYYPNDGSVMSRFDDSRLHSIQLILKLEDYFKETNNYFYPIFKKYAVARMYWSILWQCAIKKEKNEFKSFCKKHKVKKYLLRLIPFQSFRVSFSSILGIISLWLFRFFAKLFAQGKVH